MTKSEAAIELADLISGDAGGMGNWILMRKAIVAYRNAPPAKAVEVVVRRTIERACDNALGV